MSAINILNKAILFYKMAHAITFDPSAVQKIFDDIISAINSNETELRNWANSDKNYHFIMENEYDFDILKSSFRYKDHYSKEQLEKIFDKKISELEEFSDNAPIIKSLKQRKHQAIQQAIFDDLDNLFVVKVIATDNYYASANPSSLKRNKAYISGLPDILLELPKADILSILNKNINVYMYNDIVSHIQSTIVHELVHLVQRFSEKTITSGEFYSPSSSDSATVTHDDKSKMHSNSIVELEAIIASVWQELIFNLKNDVIGSELVKSLGYKETFGNFTQNILEKCNRFVYAKKYINNIDLKKLRKDILEQYGVSKKQYPTKRDYFNRFLKLGAKFIAQYNDDIVKSMVKQFFSSQEEIVGYYEIYGMMSEIKKTKSIPKIETLFSGSIKNMEEKANSDILNNRGFKKIKDIIDWRAPIKPVETEYGLKRESPLIDLKEIPQEVLSFIKKDSPSLEHIKYISFYMYENKAIGYSLFNKEKNIVDAMEFKIN